MTKSDNGGPTSGIKLSELIAQYGDENVEFQNLDHCVENFQLTKRGTMARFGTPQPFSLDGFKKLGLIIWLDRDKVAAMLAERNKP